MLGGCPGTAGRGSGTGLGICISRDGARRLTTLSMLGVRIFRPHSDKPPSSPPSCPNPTIPRHTSCDAACHARHSLLDKAHIPQERLDGPRPAQTLWPYALTIRHSLYSKKERAPNDLSK